VTGVVLVSLAIIVGILIFVYSGIYPGQYAGPPSYRMSFTVNFVVQNSTGQRQYVVPEGIGVIPSLWNNHTLDKYGLNNLAPIYTKDSSGIVLVDSSVARSYTLSDFFSIWGKTFNSTCVQLDQFYCDSGSGQSLSLVVNGRPSSAFGGYVLVNGDVIRISYESSSY
jgi:hypothetical protein